jgi:hypothetical protein
VLTKAHHTLPFSARCIKWTLSRPYFNICIVYLFNNMMNQQMHNWSTINCNTIFLDFELLHTYSPMKMEQTGCSETLAFKLQTPVNHPEDSIRRYCCLLHRLYMFRRYCVFFRELVVSIC